jgi:uncharacterized membrane-anchored protein YitT (DUF2179 family)
MSEPVSETSLSALAPEAVVPHTLVEDIFGVANGCLLVALGIHLLHMAKLITGGVAGLALMLSYIAPFSPGALFTAINLPIFLAFWRMLGGAYILRTTLATLAITLLVDVVAKGLVIAQITMPIAAIVGGMVLGMGCWRLRAMPRAWAGWR